MKNKITLSFSLFFVMANHVLSQDFIPVSSTTVDGAIRQLLVDSSRNLLYVAGQFSTIGGIINARGIVSFDGANFDTLGAGTDAYFSGCCPNPIYAIGMYNNDLMAGGTWFTIDNKKLNHIAEWNGTQWDSVPGWVDSVNRDNQDNHPLSFLQYNNELFVGGEFFKIGSTNCVDLAKWDGTQWTGFYTGIDTFYTGGIEALCFYDNRLYYGGYFDGYNNINCLGYLDSLGGVHDVGFVGGNQAVYALVVYDNELYAGGWFTKSGGNVGNYIMKWDGSLWHEVGGGMDGAIWCLAVCNNNLYAGGQFTMAGGNIAPGIARWDGFSWHALSSDTLYTVLAMAFYKNELYIGTDYHYNYFAKYTGSLNGTKENVQLPFNVNLYPNPANENLQLTITSKQREGEMQIELLDMLGETVAVFKEENFTGTFKKQISIANLSSGVYFVKVQGKEGVAVRKFVKE